VNTDEQILDAVGEIHEVIAAVGRPDARILAVTKAFPAELVSRAIALGLTDIGESYAQEVLEKADAYTDCSLHFIGRIQRNKVRKIAEHVSLWHSVDRAEIVREIAKRRPGAELLIQVNPSKDPTKAGVQPEEVATLLAEAEVGGATVKGLMTIGVHGDVKATRDTFHVVRELADQFALTECSMGMSGDYRDALEAGSTIIRVGSLLFGDRPTG